ncbi:MAG TPA: FHA domain-containing protein, partial [Chloroflexi bacterium]|nr:FHA domain-containing protein [Chloroflexota bacterium]
LLLFLRLAAAVVLLAFLGTILGYLRRDLQKQADESPSLPAVFLAGSFDGELHRFPLRHLELVGRAADNTVVVADETVSAHHARLSFMGGHQWWLEDLGSRNGTTVNGVALEEPLAVTMGDEIGFGRVSLKIVAGQEAVGEAAPPRQGRSPA